MVQLGLATELHPASNRPLGAVLNPRPDQLALELADRGQYLSHELPRRRGRINYRVLDGSEANAPLSQFGQNV
jgi:hypothetical protein